MAEEQKRRQVSFEFDGVVHGLIKEEELKRLFELGLNVKIEQFELKNLTVKEVDSVQT